MAGVRASSSAAAGVIAGPRVFFHVSPPLAIPATLLHALGRFAQGLTAPGLFFTYIGERHARTAASPGLFPDGSLLAVLMARRTRMPPHKLRRRERERAAFVGEVAVHAAIGQQPGAVCHPQNSGEFLSSVGTPIGAAGPVEEVTGRVSG